MKLENNIKTIVVFKYYNYARNYFTLISDVLIDYHSSIYRRVSSVLLKYSVLPF